MINIVDVVTIREMYPNDELFYIKVVDQDFIVRTITPDEHRIIKDLSMTEYDQEDLITKTAMIYPSGYDVLAGDAGIPKNISEIVLRLSLLHKESRLDIIERVQGYSDQLANDIEAQVPVVIKMAFPEFTFDEIERWNMDTKLKNLARAIHSLKLRGVSIDVSFDELKKEEELSLEDKARIITENGGDPMVALYEDYKTQPVLVEIPFITNCKWDNEDIMYAVQRQLHKPIKR